MQIKQRQDSGKCSPCPVWERGLIHLLLNAGEQRGVSAAQPMKNITRYTYESTDFQGWRVSIQRCGRIITRYFSDMQYGTEELSLREAVEYRDYILTALAEHRDNLPQFMDEELERLQQMLREKNFAGLTAPLRPLLPPYPSGFDRREEPAARHS